jgi:hypothetical protein
MILQKQKAFFSALWGADESLYRAVCYGTKHPNKQKWFTNTEAAINFARELVSQHKWNVYHACSLFEKPQRLKKYAVQTKALWLDVDLGKTGCATVDEVIAALLPKFEGTPLYGTYWILKTGNGLHLYWMLDKYLSKQEWLACAQKLREICDAREIPDDTVRTQDIASLMRFPYSENYKSRYKGD